MGDVIKYQKTLDRISSKLSDMKSLWEEAASIYTKAVDEDPAFRTWCEENAPSGTARIFRMLEAVGRGRLDVRVAQGAVPFTSKLIALPIEDQRRLLDTGVDVLLPSGDTIRGTITTLNRDQIKQIIAKDHIRNAAEQKMFVESNRPKTSKGYVKMLEPDKKRKGIIFNGILFPISDVLDCVRKVTG